MLSTRTDSETLISSDRGDISSTAKLGLLMQNTDNVREEKSLSKQFKVEDKIKENCLLLISEFLMFIAKNVEYSLSGYNHNIDRGDIGNYKKMGKKQEEVYQALEYASSSQDYITAFRIMFENKIADCGDQSLYLGILLAGVTFISNRYLILAAGKQGSDVNHNFLILVPHSSAMFEGFAKIELEKLTIELEDLPGEYSAELFLDNKDLIFIDPWQNKIFPSGITADIHPFDFIKTIDIKKQLLTLQQIKHEFFARIQDLHREILKDKILSLPNVTRLITNLIEDGNFNQAFIEGCKNEDTSDIAKLLLLNKHLFNVSTLPIAALNEGLKIAKENNNSTAIEIILKYSEPFLELWKANEWFAKRHSRKDEKKNNDEQHNEPISIFKQRKAVPNSSQVENKLKNACLIS